MAAGITATLTGSTLTVNCTDRNDQVKFLQLNNRIAIVNVSGSWAGVRREFDRGQPWGGDDFVSLTSTANGGNQGLAENFTIRTGGTEKIRLANGTEATITGAQPHVRRGPTAPRRSTARRGVPLSRLACAASAASSAGANAAYGQLVRLEHRRRGPAGPLGSTLFVDKSINRSDMIGFLATPRTAASSTPPS